MGKVTVYQYMVLDTARRVNVGVASDICEPFTTKGDRHAACALKQLLRRFAQQLPRLILTNPSLARGLCQNEETIGAPIALRIAIETPELR